METQIIQAQLAGMVALTDNALIGTDEQQRITFFNHKAESLFGYTIQEILDQPLALLVPCLADAGSATVSPVVTQQEITGVCKDGSTFVARVAIARVAVAGNVLVTIVVREIYPLAHSTEAQLRAHADYLDVLATASQAFAQAGPDCQTVLEQVTRHLAEALGNACVIALLTDDAQWLRPMVVYDVNPENLALLRATFASTSIHVAEKHGYAQVFQSGQAMLIAQVNSADVRTKLKPEYWPVFDLLHVHSVVIAPLQVQGKTIGVMMLSRCNHERPAFTEHDLRLVQDLANRAAATIANARLFDQVQQELAARQRAEQALSVERALLVRRVAERTADLSLANAELARAARLKDEFLANMSHELRTPLNAILGRSEALQEAIYGSVTAEQVAALHGIAESGQHLLTLINDILDLSKIEAGRLTLERAILDVDLLSTMVLRMVAQTAMIKRITLTSSFDGHVQRIAADERRFKQILVNLLSNAVKFTPEGGKVGLDVCGDPEQQTATFTVWDTGIGIAPEDLSRLFKPFVQLDSRLSRQYTGSGLGLSLVSQLAQAHGGSVAVESVLGQGSRFSVTLPWIPTDETSDYMLSTAAVDISRPIVRQALVIEDSPTAAAQIMRYLRELGANVEIHPHGIGTIERAIALRPDVIILDLLLPDDDGWTVLRQLKADPRTQAIPVLVISVVDEPEQVHRLGAAALLVKPIDRSMLEQMLRYILARHEEPPVQTALVVAPYMRRPRVLLVDDNEETIDTLTDYLRAKGYDPVVARSGSEAIVCAQEELLDVILMDIQMPGMDGLEAIRYIRAQAGMMHVPIFAVTALAMPGDRERCLAAGADAYIAKPVNLRALMTMIESYRQRRAGSAHEYM